MVSYKNSIHKPKYIKCNCFAENPKISIPFKILKKYLEDGYKPSEIFYISTIC